MIPTYSKNKTAYLPAIKTRTGTAKIHPRRSFLGYTKKESAIQHAQHDIQNKTFYDYRPWIF